MTPVPRLRKSSTGVPSGYPGGFAAPRSSAGSSDSADSGRALGSLGQHTATELSCALPDRILRGATDVTDAYLCNPVTRGRSIRSPRSCRKQEAVVHVGDYDMR